MLREEMLEFVEAVLSAVSVPHAVASLTETRLASVRFGQNRITQNLDIFRRELTLTVGDGERKATVTSQKIDKSALPGIVDEAEDLMLKAAPDPEYMPPVPAGQTYEDIPEAWDPYTAGCPSEPRMTAVGKVIDGAEASGLEAAGICFMSSSKTILATSTGNRCWHRSTGAGLSFTMDKGLASSYKALSATGWKELDVEQSISQVISQVEMDEGATELEPGEYRLILEPEATWNLLMFLPWIMDARTADEGTSVFSNMEGKKITGDCITLSSSLHSVKPGIPFNEEGLPASESVWIKEGVLQKLPCDRFTASETGREPLFIPESLDLKGGDGSVDDLIRTVDRGILIRRFWYIRFVDSKTLKLTGMTRDGVFLVENGKITGPIKDFRWNWRPLELFAAIERMGTPERKYYGLVPPVVISPQTSPFTG